MKKPIFIILFVFVVIHARSQDCSNLNIKWQSDISSSCDKIVMTMIHDVLDRPYLYVANKESGLNIYDISQIQSPKFVSYVPITRFAGLEVMNLSQDSNFIYLTIGNHFTNPQEGGMAIIDVTDPTTPVVTDYYIVPGSESGAGVAKTLGNYAYLGAMQSGLVILDISDKTAIKPVSQFIPDINYPVKDPNPDLYNSRGMEVIDDIVYLCHDAGGIRIINCKDPENPKETGRFCNPAMYLPFNRPKAYNNCVINDSLLYVAVDYAGIEVLDISDTSSIKLSGWWNPYNAPGANWFSSPGHMNEIQFDKESHKLFISSGKSDLHVVDVTDPSNPDSCNYYGGVSNNIGTWGVGLWKNQIYLSYICALIPFYSNWTGVKILTYNPVSGDISGNTVNQQLQVYPNPVMSKITIEFNRFIKNGTISITNQMGVKVNQIEGIMEESIDLNFENLSAGLYYLQVKENGNVVGYQKVVVAGK